MVCIAATHLFPMQPVSAPRDASAVECGPEGGVGEPIETGRRVKEHTRILQASIIIGGVRSRFQGHRILINVIDDHRSSAVSNRGKVANPPEGQDVRILGRRWIRCPEHRSVDEGPRSVCQLHTCRIEGVPKLGMGRVAKGWSRGLMGGYGGFLKIGPRQGDAVAVHGWSAPRRRGSGSWTYVRIQG